MKGVKGRGSEGRGVNSMIIVCGFLCLFCFATYNPHGIFKTGSFSSSICCDFFYPLGKSKSCCAKKKIK